MELSKRVGRFGEGIFARLLTIKNARTAAGKWVCDLSVGTPNIPPAPHILETMSREAADPKNYIYAISDTAALQDAVAVWYRRRYGVELDPRTEVSSLLGSQEGLSHIALSYADEGDVVMVPDPCYPVFGDGPLIAGAELYYMSMKRENDFLIDLDAIPESVAQRAKLMIVSYPNNPTTALAPDWWYEKLIAFAKKYGVAVLHDNAYSELVFDGGSTGSFLAFDGAKDVGVEFNSLSKTYGMAGARVGFCVGNAEMVKAMRTLKSNMDYGMFLPVQKAAIAAITGDQSCVAETCAAYEKRRNALCDGLTAIGWEVERCRSTMFVWARIPAGFDSSESFAMSLLERTGVIVTPGSAFGPGGEGFVRMALVQDEDVIRRAVEEIKNSGILG